MEPTQERWLPVAGYEGLYEVSDLARVRRNGRILRPGSNAGYPMVSLWMNGIGRSYTVHQLVAEAFLGPRPSDHEVCHRNGNRADSRLANLRYDSPAGNQADTLIHGTRIWGERHRSAKLTEAKVLEIRALYVLHGPTALAAVYGVSPSAIFNAANGVTWKHIKEPGADAAAQTACRLTT